jgi:hypothetical protein
VIIAVFYIKCDRCGARTEAEGDSVEEARTHALSEGWIKADMRTSDGGMVKDADLCYECGVS